MELMEIYHEAMATWIIAGVTSGKCEGAEFVFGLIESAIRKEATEILLIPMVPAGTPTEETIEHLRPFLESGDTIIVGGNSFYKDDVRRSDSLKKEGIHYLDAGTSGGVWGIERGYCLMIGGDEGAVKRLEPIFEALAPGQGDIAPSPGRQNIKSTAEKGFLYCGPSGAGHFVKMIHNGIEYGVMQAYAEGFDILRGAGSEAQFLPQAGF